MKIGSKRFDAVYKKLNPAQKQAVDTIEGPLMVIAGPGTGKTHVLAARIANILLKTDTPPHAILALTFTESAANNMRARVVSIMGNTGYYVNISTFHSFCVEIIKTNPEYFEIDRNSEALSSLSRYGLFESIIKELPLKALKPLSRTMFYLTDIASSISDLKREGITPDNFDRIVKKAFAINLENLKLTKAELNKEINSRHKNQELATVYHEYEIRLRQALAFDFDDMVALVVEAFNQHKELLLKYQETLHYFLIDEYQDTNSAQNKIVSLLAEFWGEKADVFVVGDPNQAIFRFQGASIENVADFAKKYPNAPIINLSRSYRSPQFLLDSARTVINNNLLTSKESSTDAAVIKLFKVLETKLISDSKSSTSKINLYSCPSQIVEHIYIAEKIKNLISTGVAPEEIAILYRHNSDASELQSILEKWGVSYSIEGGEDVLKSELIRQLIVLLRTINELKAGIATDSLFELMCYEWTQISSTLAMKIGRVAGKNNLSIYDTVASGLDFINKHHVGTPISEKEFESVVTFMQKIVDWGTRDSTKIFSALFEEIIKESGFLNYILVSESSMEHLINLNSLYREIKALNREHHDFKLIDFLQATDLMSQYHLPIFADDLNIERGAIHLSTVHKAKGREWSHVFLVNLTDRKWGNNRVHDLIPLPTGILSNTDISKKEQNEDERRLFYVALTRAKSNVYLSYPETIVSELRSRVTIPSMFLSEMGEKFVDKIVPQVSEDMHANLTKLVSPVEKKVIVSDKQYFRLLVSDFKLSVTALNTYLRDNQEFVENVLLRVPRAKPPHMGFGSAIHIALEKFYNAKQQNKKINDGELYNHFARALKEEILTKEDLQSWLSRGKETLIKYHEEYKNENVSPLFIERYFGRSFSRTVLDDIVLTGRVDRIDILNKDDKTVRVIDYKTGHQRTIGEIEGKTVSAKLSDREQKLPESIRGPLKRQLLFYKLLAQLDSTLPYTVESGMFDFVEADKASGKLVRREFELLDSDVNDLKELIRTVMKEIRNLEFLEK